MNAVDISSGTQRGLFDNPALTCIAVLTLVAVVIHAPLLIAFAAGMLGVGHPMQVINVDFANYWMAGQMTLSGGQQELFSFPVYFAHLQAAFGADYPVHNWGYPPHFLLLLWPLGLLGYKVGLLMFLAVTFALFAWAVFVFRKAYAPRSDLRLLVLALFGYSLMMIYTTQNGFLTSALLLFGLAWMKQRPAAAGLAFALLTIKPQLGLLIPVLLLLDRNWRTLIWAGVFTVAVVGLSAALFGVQSWMAFVTETMGYQRYVMTEWSGIFLCMMRTAFAGARTLGFTADTAYLMQWPVSIVGAVLVFWAWRRQSDPLQRAFTLVCGTFVISPYAFNYDMGALSAIAAMIVGSQPIKRFASLAVSVVAALAACVTILGRSNLPIAPLLLILAIWALADGADRAVAADGAHAHA